MANSLSEHIHQRSSEARDRISWMIYIELPLSEFTQQYLQYCASIGTKQSTDCETGWLVPLSYSPPAVKLHFIELDFVLIESNLGHRLGCFGGLRKINGNISNSMLNISGWSPLLAVV